MAYGIVGWSNVSLALPATSEPSAALNSVSQQPGVPNTDFCQMTVKSLKHELNRRGLPTNGLKPALIERLQHAMTQPDDHHEAVVANETAAPAAAAAPAASLLDRLVDQQASPLLQMVLAKVPEEDAFVVQLSSVRLHALVKERFERSGGVSQWLQRDRGLVPAPIAFVGARVDGAGPERGSVSFGPDPGHREADGGLACLPSRGFDSVAEFQPSRHGRKLARSQQVAIARRIH